MQAGSASESKGESSIPDPEPSSGQEPLAPATAEQSSLLQQNLALRTQNLQLAHRLQTLSSKLEAQLTSTAPSPSLQQELANSLQLMATYKKQISFLKGRLTDNPESQMQDLQVILKGKDMEIELLKKEITALKRDSDKKQRTLMIVDEGEGKYQAQYQRLLDEYHRVQRRCEEYQKMLRKRNPIPRLVEVHSNEHTSCIAKYEKEIQALKNAEMRSKKTFRHLNWQLGKLKEQNEELHERLRDKQREVFESHGQLLKYKKQIKRSNHQSIDLHQFRSVQTTSHRTHLHKQTVLPPLYEKAVYPRIEYAGKSYSNGKNWNDLKLSSKILGIKVELNDNGAIQRIDCVYEKGETSRIPQQSDNVLEFMCQKEEFIQAIQGGFDGQFLTYVVFKTNCGKSVTFGTENTDTIPFNFEIGTFQCPVSLFGESMHIEHQRKINKFGCLIEKLD